ncbi:4-hydroxybenzoate octaprenyltransferase [Phytophthora cactorum]|nr:4-hydroxybenzoate octaprenyltransferase [Phytophthora cactorum]
MAARLLLARAAGRPRATPTALQLAFPSVSRSGIARFSHFTPLRAVSVHSRVSFTSTGTQRSWFSTGTPPSPSLPHVKQGNEQDKSEVLLPKEDAFSIEKDTWAERHVPEWMLPYIQIARINRPGPTFMLLWPCFWSIAMAAPALLALFGTGSLIMRSAGCTINDMWDKDFDKQVERTNKRRGCGKAHIPTGVGFLAGQLSAGLAVLLQLNWYSVAMGASSLALVASYPTMKRFTYWPQAVLGLTFNYGALLGWAAVHGSCEWPVVLPLYAGGVAWTLVYDTLYAHQDKKDDIKIGVRSTALLFGDKTKPVLNFFSAAAIAGFGTAGYMAGLDWPFFVGLTGGAAHLAWQVNTAKLDDHINLQARFASNKWFGALMFASVVAGNVV